MYTMPVGTRVRIDVSEHLFGYIVGHCVLYDGQLLYVIELQDASFTNRSTHVNTVGIRADLVTRVTERF